MANQGANMTEDEKMLAVLKASIEALNRELYEKKRDALLSWREANEIPKQGEATLFEQLVILDLLIDKRISEKQFLEIVRGRKPTVLEIIGCCCDLIDPGASTPDDAFTGPFSYPELQKFFLGEPSGESGDP